MLYNATHLKPLNKPLYTGATTDYIDVTRYFDGYTVCRGSLVVCNLLQFENNNNNKTPPDNIKSIVVVVIINCRNGFLSL